MFKVEELSLKIKDGKSIAVDFDGVIVTDKFPEIGEPNLELVKWLNDYQARGGKLVLWTSRNNECDFALNKAVAFCKSIGLEFDAVNENLPEVKAKWGADTRKVLTSYYLDDKAVEWKSMN